MRARFTALSINDTRLFNIFTYSDAVITHSDYTYSDFHIHIREGESEEGKHLGLMLGTVSIHTAKVLRYPHPAFVPCGVVVTAEALSSDAFITAGGANCSVDADASHDCYLQNHQLSLNHRIPTYNFWDA